MKVNKCEEKSKIKERKINFMTQTPKSKQHKNIKEQNTHNTQPL
jgi:hypothetical protein